MEKVLATNGPYKCPTWERILDSTPPFYMFLTNVMLIVLLVIILKQGDTNLFVWTSLLTVFFFSIYMFLFVLDNHFRLFHSKEIVSIKDDALVIDCSNSFLRRYKSIPLSSIRQIEHYNGSRGSSLHVPDTLRVHYGRHSRYRFAINMQYRDSCQLAKEIMNHILK